MLLNTFLVFLAAGRTVVKYAYGQAGVYSVKMPVK